MQEGGRREAGGMQEGGRREGQQEKGRQGGEVGGRRGFEGSKKWIHISSCLHSFYSVLCLFSSIAGNIRISPPTQSPTAPTVPTVPTLRSIALGNIALRGAASTH